MEKRKRLTTTAAVPPRSPATTRHCLHRSKSFQSPQRDPYLFIFPFSFSRYFCGFCEIPLLKDFVKFKIDLFKNRNLDISMIHSVCFIYFLIESKMYLSSFRTNAQTTIAKHGSHDPSVVSKNGYRKTVMWKLMMWRISFNNFANGKPASN
jgi:hypothetical protein